MKACPSELKAFDGVTINLQKSNSRECVFYRLHDSKEAEEIFIKRMKSTKAAAVVVNRAPEGYQSENLFVAGSEFTRWLVELLDYYYPLGNQILVGVTGTNGKTTIVDLARQLAHGSGLSAWSIGTLGVVGPNGISPTKLLSPSCPSLAELRRVLHEEMKEADVVFMEATSHGLEQKRLENIKFSAVAWSNFTRDHLDYHGTFGNYWKAKLLLLRNHLVTGARIFLPNTQRNLVARIRKEKLKNPIIESNVPINSECEFFVPKHNRENLSLATALVEDIIGYKLEIPESMLKPPAGRFEIIQGRKGTAVIDYAHSPDALESLLKAARKAWPSKNIVIVCGCGGDRDKGKRSLMSQKALQFSDMAIFTSDNPRTEDPEKILDDMCFGIREGNYKREADRKKGIILGLQEAGPEGIAVIAGKGHEDYQEIGKEKFPFSDKEILLEELR